MRKMIVNRGVQGILGMTVVQAFLEVDQGKILAGKDRNGSKNS